jgi:hypothetical protein
MLGWRGVTAGTLPSCALTWARSAVLANSACRSWVNGSSLVVSVLACRVVETDEFARWCRRCGCEAAPRDSVTRRLAHEPLVRRPTTLLITIRRYRCTGCGHVWRQDTSRAAEPRAKLSLRALRWALEGIVCQHLTVARVAEGLGVSWIPRTTPAGRGQTFVGRGPTPVRRRARDRRRRALLAPHPPRRYKTATDEELPDAVAVMDPFHVVRLVGDALATNDLKRFQVGPLGQGIDWEERGGPLRP